METTRQDTAAERAAPRQAGATTPRRTANKVWELKPKDVNEPPFHYLGVPPSVVVVAADEDEARRFASASGPEMAPAGFAMREVPLPEGAPAPKPDDPPRERERVAVEARSPWRDPELTTCAEVDLTEARVLSRAAGP